MKRSSPPAVCHVLILALLLFGSLGVGSTRAQGPVPPVQPDPVPSPQAVESTEYDAEILTTPPVVTAQEVEEDASAAVAAQPEIGDGPLLAIAAEQEPVSVTAEGTPAALQGIVKLDVSTPDEIRAGGYITYTYAYTNTGAAAATGIKLRATWTRFKPADTGGIDQYCDPPTTSGANPCDVLAGSLRGPHVQMLGLIAGGADYSIGDLAGGQSGRFSVLLRARSDVYPQANKSLVRPAGSGQLFLNGSNVPTSEDTAATLITGPVMVLSKRLAVTGKLLPT